MRGPKLVQKNNSLEKSGLLWETHEYQPFTELLAYCRPRSQSHGAAEDEVNQKHFLERVGGGDGGGG